MLYRKIVDESMTSLNLTSEISGIKKIGKRRLSFREYVIREAKMWHINVILQMRQELREETIEYAHKSFCRLTKDKIIIRGRFFATTV